GYGLRVGLEDNIWFDSRKKKKARNIEQLERIHQLMKIHEKSLITSQEFGNLGYYNRKQIQQSPVVNLA
ncbi:MAG: 3-keto-5-aminohexanoate cleavage protein, partial [Rhodothermaceae bacterium]|nr:3-keto-5-aminohexanoate cleavage protein [Rhodothermaceae bacterium]